MGPRAFTGRLLAYGRVSGFEQGAHGTSLAAQEEGFHAFAERLRLPAPVLYIEVESAGDEKIERRVELARLIRDAQPGDIIITDKVDRWSRDLPFGVASVRALVKRGVGWRSLSENIDATTPEGDNALGFMALIADMERKRIRERTVGARQRLRAMGFHVEGNAPPGYVIEGRKLVPGPTAEIVRRMFVLSIEGKSTREISDELGHLPGLDAPAIAKRLRDRRYIGESSTVGAKAGSKRKVAGVWRATHEPLIDRATWDAAQASLDTRREGGRPAVGGSRVDGFLLRGWGRCAGCGHTIRCQAPLPGSSTTHAGWYCCAKGCGPYARQDAVDAHLEQLVLARLEELRAHLAGPPPAPKVAPDLSAARARAAARLDRLIDAIADGTIARDAARAKVAKVEAEIADIDRRRAAAEGPPAAPPRAERLATVEGLREAWSGLDVAGRRAALRLLAERVEVARIDGAAKWSRAAWRIAVIWRAA